MQIFEEYDLGYDPVPMDQRTFTGSQENLDFMTDLDLDF